MNIEHQTALHSTNSRLPQHAQLECICQELCVQSLFCCQQTCGGKTECCIHIICNCFAGVLLLQTTHYGEASSSATLPQTELRTSSYCSDLGLQLTNLVGWKIVTTGQQRRPGNWLGHSIGIQSTARPHICSEL